MEALALKIFEKCSGFKNFNKLKLLLLAISKENPGTGFAWSLQFYSTILKNLKKQLFIPEIYENNSGKSAAVYFLDFMGVLEDLLNSDFAGNDPISLEIYIPIIDELLNIGGKMQLILSTFPPLPGIGFDGQRSLFNESPQVILSENTIYLREGGYLRLILKFIFIGLNVSPDKQLIRQLKNVLQGGAPNSTYLTIAVEQKNKWELRFAGTIIEKYTDCYLSLRDKKDDVMYSTQFLTQYVIAECTEIIQQEPNRLILEFLKDFIRDTEALTCIEKNKLTDQEIEEYYKLLRDQKLFVHSTARSRLNYHEKNKNIDLLNQYLDSPNLPDSRNFTSEMKEIFLQYKKDKDKNDSLLNLLLSQN